MILIDNRGATDPYINLAIEEFLIRNADCGKGDFLHLYINEPCVVLGKNQSIYKEINFEFLRSGKLKLARRISGGGTVYQDEGNLNFSFISSFRNEKINNYRQFNQPVVEALRKMGVEAEMDTRNNILVEGKKISGNAQFTNRKNIISHGTLLFSADLLTLRACLKPNAFKIETKAVNSVPSGITNINQATGKFANIGGLKAYLINELTAGDVYCFTHSEWNEIEKLATEKFGSFEWVYGRSPLSRILKGEIEIVIEHGIVTEISEDFKQLIGERYDYASIKKAVEMESNAANLVDRVF